MKKLTLIVFAALFAFTLSAQNNKFGYINITELVMLTADADSARVRLQAYQKELEDEMESMQTEYNNKVNTYQQKQATWTAAIKESKEAEIIEMQQRLQQFQQTAGSDLQQLQATLFNPIVEKAEKAVEKIAKEKGLPFVFRMDSNPLVYYNEAQGLDLLPLAKAALGVPADKVAPSQLQ